MPQDHGCVVPEAEHVVGDGLLERVRSWLFLPIHREDECLRSSICIASSVPEGRHDKSSYVTENRSESME